MANPEDNPKVEPDLEAYHSQQLEFSALPGDETGDSGQPPKLTRTQSMKVAASAAADHLNDHKHKYSVCAIVSIAAIVVGCVLGIVAAVIASKGGGSISLENQLAASKGTSLKRVSPIPPKGYLFFSSNHFFLNLVYDILCFLGSGSRRRMMSAKSSFGILKSLIRKFGFLSTEGSKSFPL